MTIPTPDALENLPYVHLRHLGSDCGIIRGFVNPKLRRQSVPSKFQIVPLLDNKGNIDPTIGSIRTRQEFLRLLRAEWKYIAIRCEEGKFMSCRTAIYLPIVGRSSVTEYRSTIGEFETFQVEYHPGSGCFSFLTHNGLYMNANETMWTVESRDVPRSPGETIASHRSWSVYPRLPKSSEEERVAFLGVVDDEVGQFEMKLKPERVDLSEDHLADMKKHFIENLSCGEAKRLDWNVCLIVIIIFISIGNQYMFFKELHEANEKLSRLEMILEQKFGMNGDL